MKILEFLAPLNPDHTVTIPPDVAAQVEQTEPVRVVLLLSDPRDDREWARLTSEQFAKGYSEGDSIYDKL